jgi:hypothetical protein
MYEFTHKGLWFNWSALDRKDKRLAGISLGASAVGGALLGIGSTDGAYGLGYRLGSGGKAPPSAGIAEAFGPAFSWLFVASAVALSLGLIFWWLFSRRQDEMFNRVQNYAVGLSCTLTMALGMMWAVAAMGGAVPAPSFMILAIFDLIALTILWMHAVKKWG